MSATAMQHLDPELVSLETALPKELLALGFNNQIPRELASSDLKSSQMGSFFVRLDISGIKGFPGLKTQHLRSILASWLQHAETEWIKIWLKSNRFLWDGGFAMLAAIHFDKGRLDWAVPHEPTNEGRAKGRSCCSWPTVELCDERKGPS